MGQENEKGQVVIYDGINTQAWLGTKPNKKGVNYALTKRFKNNKLARAYAFKLAKKYKAPIYDKDYGVYIGKYAKATTPKKYVSKGLGLGGLFVKPKSVARKEDWLRKILPF